MSASQLITAEDDLDRLLKDKFTSDFRTGYIEIDGFCLPEHYENFADAIENMEVYDDDIWVCSFPKTGSTWMQEMVWCIANDLNFEAAKIVLNHRFRFLESASVFDFRSRIGHITDLIGRNAESILNSVEYINKLARPRFIKTHLPFNLLPRQIRAAEKTPKVVYVTRNPKDTCVSYYHHCKRIEGYRGDFDEFCRLFLGEKVYPAPFWNHVLSYWKQRERENVLFIKYEDMKRDLTSVIRKTGNFLGKTVEPSRIEILKKHLSFENMKANPAVNQSESKKFLSKMLQTEIIGEFMRSGQVNHGKGTMSDDVIADFDRCASVFDFRSRIGRIADLDGTIRESILNSVEHVNKFARPRYIKTHLPFNLLPRQIRTSEKKPKIVCVTRNPKDTCVSSYHFEKFRYCFRGDFDEFCRLFLAGKLYGAPFWNNVLSFWKERERDNLLIIKYEDMKSDLASVIRKTANFLGKSLEPSGIEALQEHLSFETMKANPAVNHSKSMENLQKLLQVELKGEFIRSGQVNHGKGTMSDDVIAEFDKWTAKHLESSDFPL